MFAGEARAYLSEGWSTFQVLYSRVGFWPYPQTLDTDGKACQEQTLLLITNLVQIADIESFITLAQDQIQQNLFSFIISGDKLACWSTFPSELVEQLHGSLEPGNPCWRGRFSTVDLLALTSLEQLLLICQTKFTYCRTSIMRRSTVLSLSLQLVFPGKNLPSLLSGSPIKYKAWTKIVC